MQPRGLRRSLVSGATHCDVQDALRDEPEEDRDDGNLGADVAVVHYDVPTTDRLRALLDRSDLAPSEMAHATYRIEPK